MEPNASVSLSISPSLAERLQDFAYESCGLSGMDQQAQETYLQCCLEARSLGLRCQRVGQEQLQSWSECLHVDVDVDRARALLSAWNDKLEALGPEADDASVVALYADWLRTSQQQLPGRIARLFLLSFAARTKRLFPLLRVEDGAALKQLLRSKEQARLWMAERFREAVLSSGVVYTVTEQEASQASYVGPSGKRLIVQWHDLAAAQERWRGRV